MANRHRGEIEADIGGTRRRLVLTLGALAELEDAFGAEADYAQLHKVYRAALENETRYSPAKCIGCDMKAVSGTPDFKHVSTSFVEGRIGVCAQA